MDESFVHYRIVVLAGKELVNDWNVGVETFIQGSIHQNVSVLQVDELVRNRLDTFQSVRYDDDGYAERVAEL